MNPKLTAVLRKVPVIVVMGTIFFLSHQSGDSLPLPRVPGFDKLAHMIAYGVLAATALFAVREQAKNSKPGRVMVHTVIFCILYGISDEFHQTFIPGRFVSISDLCADGAGAMISCMLWSGWRKRAIRSS